MLSFSLLSLHDRVHKTFGACFSPTCHRIIARTSLYKKLQEQVTYICKPAGLALPAAWYLVQSFKGRWKAFSRGLFSVDARHCRCFIDTEHLSTSACLPRPHCRLQASSVHTNHRNRVDPELAHYYPSSFRTFKLTSNSVDVIRCEYLFNIWHSII